MTQQVKMPEPVAWAHFAKDGLIQVWSRRKTDVESMERLMGKRPNGLITTTQAEAYADARVREALEEAAQLCDDEASEWDSDGVITEKSYAECCAKRIRALIPPQQ